MYETATCYKIVSPNFKDEIYLPLATYETPLWPSVNRGASVSRLCGGIKAVVADDNMARAVLLETTDTVRAAEIVSEIKQKTDQIKEVIAGTSRFAKLKDLQFQIVGKLIYIRLCISAGDASGHNMVTKAADILMSWLIREISDLSYVSISANYCADKKVSAVMGKLAESNAPAMHATMLTAWPPLLYSNEETVKAMKKVWRLRESGLPVFFTQDAGPNLKMLFPTNFKEKVLKNFPDLYIVQPFQS